MKNKKILVLSIASVICIGITALAVSLIINSRPTYVLNDSIYAAVSADELEEKADIIVVAEYTGNTNQVVVDENVKPDAWSPVYTDHIFKVTEIAKGKVGEEVNIRIDRGTLDGITYDTTDSYDFEKGEKYFLYLKKGENIVENDVDNYYLFAGSQCRFEIDGEGKIDLSGEDSEDAPGVQAIYDTVSNV